MGAIANLDALVNALTTFEETLLAHRYPRVAGAAASTLTIGQWSSLWQYGGVPGAGVAPGAVEAPTVATPGALPFTGPGGGRQKWLTGMSGGGFVAGTLLLYDRLLHIGGLSGTVLSPQTVGGTLTRYTGGLGNQIFIEIHTSIGSTASHITANYTNENGTSGRVSQLCQIGGTGWLLAQRFLHVPLNDDAGVQAVASVTLTGTTGTAGSFGVVVAHPLAYLPIGVIGQGSIRDMVFGLPSLQSIQPNACLALAWFPSVTTPPDVTVLAHTVEA